MAPLRPRARAGSTPVQHKIACASGIEPFVGLDGEPFFGENLNGISVLLSREDRKARPETNRLNRQMHPVDCIVEKEPIVHSGTAKDQSLVQRVNIADQPVKIGGREIGWVQPKLGWTLPTICFR